MWELGREARSDMRVPARVFADRELIGQIAADRSLEQLQNVATLPGITGAALASRRAAWAMTSTAVCGCLRCR